MANQKPELYNWDKFTKPRTHSRSQRVTTNNDISDWIQKVEHASGNATAEAFGTKAPSRVRSKKSATVQATIADVHMHDAAYSEAQELLQNWVDTKLDFDTEMDYTDEKWNVKTQADIKKEWDHLLGDDEEEEVEPEMDYLAKYGIKYNRKPEPVSARMPTSSDIYSILNENNDDMVDSIVQNLLDKEVIPESVTRDLDLDGNSKKHHDPRTKMKLRQQQVKENREKREREKANRLKEQQSRKDSQLKARQIVHKEEQKKVSKQKREEFEIQKEMARIRKELEMDRQMQEEKRLKALREREDMKQRVQEEYERQKIEEHKHTIKAQRLADIKQRQIMSRLEEIEQREAVENMKTLQKCFSSWYNLVVQRRLKLGKAKAMSDWKLLLRSFNGWKSYVRSHRIDRETVVHEHHMKLDRRNQTIAANHWRSKQLRKCMTAWQIFVDQQRSHKHFEHEKTATRGKMSSFLEVVTSGKLWGEGDSARQDSIRKSLSLEDLDQIDSTREKVEGMFAQKSKKQPGPYSARSDSTTSRSTARPGSSKSAAPLQAWQVNKSHIKLIGQGQGDRKSGAKDSSRSDVTEDNTSRSKKPWAKTPFVANNFEHRHNAQQTILENQQKQLKEQQRIIEELQYLQKQQLLQQQVTTQHLLGKTVATDNREPVTNEQISKLQAHLNSVQKSLLEAQITQDDRNRSPPESDRSELELVTPMQSERSETTVGNQTARTDMTSTTNVSSVSKVTTASTNSKHDKFLKTMDERAAERARIKKEREDKKRKQEEVELAKREAAALERMQKEEEEKRRKAEAYKDKKRQEKLREEEKRHQANRLQRLALEADEHKRLALLKYRGFKPWCKLVVMARDKHDRAVKHHQQSLLRKCLLSWNYKVQCDLAEKKAMADDMYKYIILKRSLDRWRHLNESMVILEQKADKFYTRRLKLKVLREWGDWAEEEKVAGWHKERRAKEHNIIRMKKTAFKVWRDYPQYMKDEADREKRRRDMRKKVASMLPDYRKSVEDSRDSFT